MEVKAQCAREPLGTVDPRFCAKWLAHTKASWPPRVENQRLTQRPRWRRHASQAGRRGFEPHRPLCKSKIHCILETASTLRSGGHFAPRGLKKWPPAIFSLGAAAASGVASVARKFNRAKTRTLVGLASAYLRLNSLMPAYEAGRPESVHGANRTPVYLSSTLPSTGRRSRSTRIAGG